MVDKLAKKGQVSGLKLVAFQLLLVLFAALISTVFFSNKAGYSALLGGITFLLPNLIFVLMTFAHAGARQSQKVLRGFYAGEAIKLFLTVLLFVVFLKYGTLSLIAFYISFALLVTSQWLAPFFFYNNDGIKHVRSR
ncbi:ATP synthase subunit I [Psychromonas sp. L1A2]|uniref:ATP synthase subunit I n=1 Tax=Psychromonas sp. L1A2 TaxID=2686356 RepID=UPI001357F715|nr:ATP synthase subunit I [Psychromonas sp. L1A2]